MFLYLIISYLDHQMDHNTILIKIVVLKCLVVSHLITHKQVISCTLIVVKESCILMNLKIKKILHMTRVHRVQK